MTTPRPPARTRAVQIIVAVLTCLAAVGVTIAVVADNGPDGTRHRGITVTLGGPGHDRVPLPPPAQQVAQSQAAQDRAGDEDAAHSGLHAEPPAATRPAVLRHDARLRPAGQPRIPLQLPLASASTPGCRTLLVRNFSSRGGAPILLVVLHFTVSVDNGWAGVLGNVRWFDSPAAQASSNYIVDRRIGACALTVAEASKAWAQAGFNRVSLSVEVTANGREGSYFPPGPGRARIIALLRRFHSVYKIPYRHGAVAGCSVVRTGFVMHKDLGACGGGHVDVTPYGIDDLIREAARSSTSTASPRRYLTRDETRAVTCLERQRRIQHRHGGWDHVAPSHLRTALACKNSLRVRVRLITRLGHLEQRHRRDRLVVIRGVIAAH